MTTTLNCELWKLTTTTSFCCTVVFGNTHREVVGEYVEELRKLGQKILELLSEGLGISPSYFRGGLSGNPVLLVNNYPSCPDPSLTLGLVRHRDPSLITILLQEEIDGLQVFKDGQWIGVQPLRHAFVVNTGYVLQVYIIAGFACVHPFSLLFYIF